MPHLNRSTNRNGNFSPNHRLHEVCKILLNRKRNIYAAKKYLSFPLRISTVNVTKSVGNFGFGP